MANDIYDNFGTMSAVQKANAADVAAYQKTTPGVPPSPSTPPAPQAAPTMMQTGMGTGVDVNGKTQPTSTVPVITAKPATNDLNKKQGDLNQVNQAMATQAQTVAANANTQPAADTSGNTLDQVKAVLNDNQDPNSYENQQNQIVSQQKAAYDTFNSQLQQLQNGTFPLTPDQLAQVNSLQQQFNTLKAQQELANKNYTGGVTNAGIASGRARYAPEIELGSIQGTVSAGLQKIADIDVQAAGAIAQLRQGFADKNYQLINDSYKAASDFFALKSKTLTDITNNVREDARLALEQHQSAMEDLKFKADQDKAEYDKRQAAKDFALSQDIKSPAYLIGNTAYSTLTGEALSYTDYLKLTGQPLDTPEDKADWSHLQVTKNPNEMSTIQNLITKYPDAGISLNDNLEAATAKVKNSAIFSKDVYIAPNAYSGGASGGSSATYTQGDDPQVDAYITAVKNGNGTLANVPAGIRGLVAQGLSSSGQSVVNPQIDAQVKSIIAANPGEYGHAADAIDKAFGAGTATKYDSWLRSVYNDKADPATLGTQDVFSPLAGSRFTMESNRIVSNFTELPQYKLTASGLPYLQRIQAAMQTPGSISDQDLLDSLTKLNTGGNAISDAQVKLITDGKSYSDWANTVKNKFQNGGVLSDNQRQQIQQIANNIYDNYKKGYQPVYDQVTSQLKAAGIPQQFWTIPDLNTLSSKAGSGSMDDTSAFNEYNEYLKTIGGGGLTHEGSGSNNAKSMSYSGKKINIGATTYDLSTYATDPNHVNGIRKAISSIGDDIGGYVSKFNSPISSSMIFSASNKYGVDPKLLTALLVQESSLGTKGRGARTNNPGNVGNVDSGANQYFNSWQAGVDEAARQLARRKTSNIRTS